MQYVNASRFDGFSQEVLAAVDHAAHQICIQVAIYREACEERNPPKPANSLEVNRALDATVEAGVAQAAPQGEGFTQNEEPRARRPRRRARTVRADAVPVVGESAARGKSSLWAVRAVASTEEEPPQPTIAEEEPLEPTIFMRGKSFVNLALGDAHTPAAKVEVERRMLATAATVLRTLSHARHDGDSSLRHVINGREARQLLGWLTASRPPRERRQ